MAYTTVNKYTDFFNRIKYTGDGSSSRALTGFGHQPDWIWAKHRNGAMHPQINDSVMGATKWRYTSSTGVDDTSTQPITYGTDGITFNGGNYDPNTNSYPYILWSLKAGTTSGLSGGTITPSAYSINTTSKFGIYKYTGTGSNATIAHGLGVAPKVVWIKKTSGSEDWRVWFTPIGNTQYLTLNGTGAASTAASVWNSAIPTSTVFSIGTDGGVNTSGQTYVAYVWGEVPGFSAFGRYYGNNNDNGPYVYTGFKPAFLLIRQTNDTGQWRIYDTLRESYGQKDLLKYLAAESTAAEVTPSDGNLDILSNGFKVRSSGGNHDLNGNSDPYSYMAFGQSIVGSNNVPCTAR
tara:strand:- start:111 stop:1157 length:1047 start_codon:yes stop_codon:yes gene_type:complete